MEGTQHFVASAIIVDDQHRVLLILHRKLGVWLYPGGHIEPHETSDEGLVREVKEETGLDVEIIGELDETVADEAADVAVLHVPYIVLCEKIRGIETCDYHIDLIYWCRIIGDLAELEANVREAEDIGFFGIEQFEDIPMFPNTKALLRKFLHEKFGIE
jgi:8-oxo-dGTP pyrophosphatase MutT (NUDIX family)